MTTNTSQGAGPAPRTAGVPASGKGVLGVGIIGLGFMGRTHLRAWHAAEAAGYPCRVRAVFDQAPDRRSDLSGTQAPAPLAERPPGVVARAGSFIAHDAVNIAAGAVSLAAGGGRLDADAVDPAADAVHAADAQALIDDDAVQVISICTHTESHVDLALRALAAGKHVLVEKPLALTAAAIEPLHAAVLEHPNLRCLPAHCMRFWPGWSWLRDAIADGRYGAVLRAEFRRVGSPPYWAPEFYGDQERCGSALVDLHIHDVDFLTWCFGPPTFVESRGEPWHITTAYAWEEPGRPLPGVVLAEGGWLAEVPFFMGYRVEFERAVATWELGRDPVLVVAQAGGGRHPVLLPSITGYDGEVRHLLDAIAQPDLPLRVTVAEALQVARILEAERASLSAGSTVRVNVGPAALGSTRGLHGAADMQLA